MNSIPKSRLPDRTLGNVAIAGSLFLHVGLIAIFSAWQWEWTTPEKNPPETIQVKFLTAPPPTQSTEAPDSPKPTPMPPAQPMAIQPNSKSPHSPRTPKLSIPILQPVKTAPRMSYPHRKIIRRLPLQAAPFIKTGVFRAEAPANFSNHNQRTAIHSRSRISEIQALTVPRTSMQIATSTRPARSNFNIIPRIPDPIVTTQSGFMAQPIAEQLTSQKAPEDRFAALPREFSQSPPIDREAPDANLGVLRGLFTGKVRQRIAKAKYYPRVARRRGMEGQPIIAFTLGKQGQLKKVDLAQTSGYQLLDQAALEAVNQAAPYPEIPAELKTDTFKFKLPISFVLK
jgi:TonB family protein